MGTVKHSVLHSKVPSRWQWRRKRTRRDPLVAFAEGGEANPSASGESGLTAVTTRKPRRQRTLVPISRAAAEARSAIVRKLRNNRPPHNFPEFYPSHRAGAPFPSPRKVVKASGRRTQPCFSRRRRGSQFGKKKNRSNPEVVDGGDSLDSQTGTSVAASKPEVSVLDHAHHFHIENFNSTIGKSGLARSLYDYLEPHIADGAAHDSRDRRDAPACDEGTRVTIREEISGWMQRGGDEGVPQRIMWLNGPAGGGKSAIAGSFAEACKSQGLLAGCFFFSSLSPSGNERSGSRLIATLVHHISQHPALHEFSAHALKAIENYRDIFSKTLREQAECLLLGPFRKVGGQANRARWPKVIIIDGLDEVVAAQHLDFTGQPPRTSHDQNDQNEILNVLLLLSQRPEFPFSIFIASRPESNIVHFFATAAAARRTSIIERVLNSEYKPGDDIKRFLKSKFAQIRQRFKISDHLWPEERILDRLVKMSSGQFIVAVTMLRWVEDGSNSPQRQLRDLLQLKSGNVGPRNPFVHLDAMYNHILKRARDPQLTVMWIITIATAMLASVERIKPVSARFWRGFLESKEGELDYHMASIRSLVTVPSTEDGSSPIVISHKSLIDYLLDESRSGDLYVSAAACDSFIAGRIVRALKGQLPSVSRHMGEGTFLVDFLNTFMNLRLVCDPSFFLSDVAACKCHTRFLGSLCEESRTELAASDALDVAWWADCCLSEVPSPIRRSAMFIQGIYYGIHQAMKCEKNSPPINEYTAFTRRAWDSKCQMACRLWREGILAKAKEYNWCVHRLEDVELDSLETVLCSQVHDKFKYMDPRHGNPLFICGICQPIG